jgi:hypothetical protein
MFYNANRGEHDRAMSPREFLAYKKPVAEEDLDRLFPDISEEDFLKQMRERHT